MRQRIALISTHGYVAANPPLGAADTGGQVVYVLEMARKLTQLGYQVDVWTRRFGNQPESEALGPGARILRVPCGGNDFIAKEYLSPHLGEWGRNALRKIEREGLNYSFLNSHYWDAGVATRELSRQLNAPHLHTPHSLGIWKKRQMEQDFPNSAADFERLYNFSERIRCEQQLYEESHKVIATSPLQTDLLRQDYRLPARNLGMVPPGYDDLRFFPVGPATRLGLRQRLGYSGPTILALGRLARNKGYDLLLEAFAQVLCRVPSARLRLAVGGQGLSSKEAKLKNELVQLSRRLGVAERVHWGDYIPDQELPAHYRAADVFVLCSRYEPFGMTAIEAMACGTPTVVTTHGGLHRVLTFGRHALFADPFDREDLAVQICKILQYEPLRRCLERQGPERARAMFTWSGVTQRLLRLVEAA
jgi:mannosylfructose-phosphate synthase